MPLDVMKTMKQIHGGTGLQELGGHLQNHGHSWLWRGSGASFFSTLAGHLPWYTTFNFLNRNLPTPPDAFERALRHGLIGFSASVVSDCCTNSLRVLKAIRQAEGISYSEAARLVIRDDGISGLLGRGLKTRIIANGLQGLLFTALWKRLEETIDTYFFG